VRIAAAVGRRVRWRVRWLCIRARIIPQLHEVARGADPNDPAHIAADWRYFRRRQVPERFESQQLEGRRRAEGVRVEAALLRRRQRQRLTVRTGLAAPGRPYIPGGPEWSADVRDPADLRVAVVALATFLYHVGGILARPEPAGAGTLTA